MKISSKIRFAYTEEEMADAFMNILQSSKGLPGIGSFDGVYREVNCRQGRPDFIALRQKKGYQLPKLPESIGFVGSAILTILKPYAPLTFRYIVAHSEFSEDSIKRSLKLLVTSGLVEQNEKNSYRLGPPARQIQIELWAFELKLSNPKRAVFQAQQSRVYANHSLIVVPPGQEKNYMPYDASMKRWSLGLATFDPSNGDFYMSRRGRNSLVFCPEHQIYALSKIGHQ